MSQIIGFAMHNYELHEFLETDAWMRPQGEVAAEDFEKCGYDGKGFPRILITIGNEGEEEGDEEEEDVNEEVITNPKFKTTVIPDQEDSENDRTKEELKS